MKTFINCEKSVGAVKIEENGVCRIMEIHSHFYFEDIKHAYIVEVSLGGNWDLELSFLALALAEEHPEGCADRFLYPLITGCAHYYGF